MSDAFLLTRVLLRFDEKSDRLLDQLSAATFTPEGGLWVGSDELQSIERLGLVEPGVFGNHRSFFIGDFVELPSAEDEVDIEGIDHSDNYLWITGSHSAKRKKAKGKDPQEDIQRLATLKAEPNRYLLMRIPVINGEPSKTCPHPDQKATLTAAAVERTDRGNALTEALQEDPHLGPYLKLKCPLPSKENGFDIEGLAVSGNRIFLGFRGPVLSGWAIIVEIEAQEKAPGVLTLKEIGPSGRCYKKHFVHLHGLGVRELCLDGADLLILAGPPLTLECPLHVFRLKNILDRPGDTLTGPDAKGLEWVFELPFIEGKDHAEGLALCTVLGQKDCLLVVYDAPDARRRIEPHAILMDVFKLE